MVNLLESEKKLTSDQQAEMSEAVIGVEKRKREIMGILELLEDIIQRAESAEGELKNSLDMLRDSQQHKYAEILKMLQEENSEGALVYLRESDNKAEQARLAAREIESLMDDLIRKTNELRGIIQSKEGQDS